ncbi:hypothetical protein [Nonomuraea dietziae]|uniref:hypothetical protein n=1 Tax=Nonomuraea dietziae TaxID=65515 RepID=UPI0034399983
MTAEQYAQAVREALADHPYRDELVEDLDDHLAEVAAESEVPLEERLGPPEAYAAELGAAYGDRPQERRTRFRLGAARASLAGHPAFGQLAAFLPELRPGWWVLRGYALAMLLISAAGDAQLVPDALGEFALVAGVIWLSVVLGRMPRGRWLRITSALASGFAVLALMLGFLGAQSLSGSAGPSPLAYQEPVTVDMMASVGEISNIRPYAKDGTPLSDVYLYDQDGRPVTTNPEMFGYTVDRSCGEPVLNRYPLPLRLESSSPESTQAPAACATAAPTAAPSAIPEVAPTEAPTATSRPESE